MKRETPTYIAFPLFSSRFSPSPNSSPLKVSNTQNGWRRSVIDSGPYQINLVTGVHLEYSPTSRSFFCELCGYGKVMWRPGPSTKTCQGDRAVVFDWEVHTKNELCSGLEDEKRCKMMLIGQPHTESTSTPHPTSTEFLRPNRLADK